MSHYRTGLKVGETVGVLTDLRNKAKAAAMASVSKYVGVAYGDKGQEMVASGMKEVVENWYAAVSDRKDVIYAVYYEGRQLMEEYVGEIQLVARKKDIWGWLVGMGAVVGGVVLLGRKK